MAWQKFSTLNDPQDPESIVPTSTFLNLPFLLAGPILRRVEESSVSVWLAFRKNVSLTLKVYDSEDKIIGSEKLSGSTTARRIGANLWVAVVTASTNTASDFLVAGTKYYYDIQMNFNGVIKTLGSPEVLTPAGSSNGNLQIICYGADKLPSFTIPPSITIDHLHIFHGSCRKPHGNRTDALVSIDKIIEDHNSDNLAFLRPQQLFLTGDQIYADDVSELLLTMIMDASRALMGWEERLDFQSPQNIPPSSSFKEMLKPGKRALLVKNTGLSVESEKGRNHLMTLGEYFSMYLFVWSDVLWQVDYPNWLDVSTLKLSEYDSQISVLNNFKSTLQKIRRVLANIPTYMMGDDHEVTDDWFLNLEWCQTILGDNTSNIPPIVANPLGKRIVLNGLSAFAIFQAWGNTPGSFISSPPGNDLLDLLDDLTDSPSERLINSTTWVDLANLILPSISLGPNGKKSLIGGLDYGFTINYDKHQVIVLDTRTKREFPAEVLGNDLKLVRSRRKGASLISESSLHLQLTSQLSSRKSTAEVTIVISPSPVIGHTFMEETGQPAIIKGHDTIRIYNRLRSRFGKAELKPIGKIRWDMEAWAFEETIFQTLLLSLASFGKTLVLSGDVHYAFSNKVEYWNRRSLPMKKSTIVQLVSSALKNEDGGTNKVATLITSLAKNKMLRFSSYAGWSQPGDHIKVRFTQWDSVSNSYVSEYINFNVQGPPNVIEIENSQDDPDRIIVVNAPDWRYRLKFFKDLRSEGDRGLYNIANLTYPYTLLQNDVTRAAAKQNQERIEFQKIVVGRNNIGQIKFDFSTPGQESITHSFWYNASTKGLDPDNILNHTIHIIPMSGPPDIPYSSTDESSWKNFDFDFPS